MLLTKTLLPFLLVLAPQTGEGWLGVYLQNTEHPAIAEVIPGSPAAKAGLRAGDRFLAVGDVETQTREAFVLAIRGVAPGSEVELRIRRGEREMDVKARLAERPVDADLPTEMTPQPVEGQPPAPAQEVVPGRPAFLGVSVRQGREGVIVDSVVEGGPSAEAGVKAGERIVRFGDRGIVAMQDLERALARMAPGDRIDLTLRSDKGTRSVLVELGARPGSPPPEEGREDPRPPDRETPEERTGAEPIPPAAPVEFLEDMAAARRVAESQGKPILLVFGASWDSSSRALHKALADPSLADRIGRTVPVWLDTDDHADAAERLEVQELPHLRVLKNGRTVWRHEGYLPPAELARVIDEHAGTGEAAEPVGPAETAGTAQVDAEVEAALRRVARRLNRIDERLRRLETAARELEGLAELREELQAIRRLLRDLSGK